VDKNRRLVVALGSALGCSLLAIAFLLGRVTARPAQTPPAQSAPGSAASGAGVPVPSPPAVPNVTAVADLSDPTPSPSSAFAGPPGEDAGWMPPAPLSTLNGPAIGSGDSPSAGPGKILSSDQQAIADYFTRLERIEDVGAGDPQAFAASMLQSMTSGDFSGFDDLLGKARAQVQRLETMAPPPACREHHRLAVDLSRDSVEMLERLKTALMKGDSTALMSMAAEGQTLEAQAGRLKTLGETITRAAGL